MPRCVCSDSGSDAGMAVPSADQTPPSSEPHPLGHQNGLVAALFNGISHVHLPDACNTQAVENGKFMLLKVQEQARQTLQKTLEPAQLAAIAGVRTLLL